MSKSLNSRVDALWLRGRITPQELASALEGDRNGGMVKPENKQFVDVVNAEIAARQSSSGGDALEWLNALLDAKHVAVSKEEEAFD